MEPTEFRKVIELLTGRPVAKLDQEEDDALDALLRDALKNDDQIIGCSQFNELLLLVNKDRVTKLFFQTFFGTSCKIKSNHDEDDLGEGVKNFQKIAMLCFGNFIYAYHTLSKIKTFEEIEHYLGDYYRETETPFEIIRSREKKILDIKKIPMKDTPLLGYISSAEIREEHRIAKELTEKLLPASDTLDNLLSALNSMREKVKNQEKEVGVVDTTIQLIQKFRDITGKNVALTDLKRRLKLDMPKIEACHQTLEKTEAEGNKNTDIYLTWDNIDIYFATSMRKSWEYEEFFNFVSVLMKQPISGNLPKKLEKFKNELQGKTLEELKIRYFDPTQSYDKNRINKGLIESLMLKRAACTVYSVQDMDTLGKDSELAATLAQGKPVIAYAPIINIVDKTNRLFQERPADLKSHLQFVLYADESGFEPDETSKLLEFLPHLEKFEEELLWKSITDDDAIQAFQREHNDNLREFCEIIAHSEQRIYNKREKTLREDHPLAIQVNLDSGVANGVLLVRDIQTCADLLLRVLTNSMEFDVNYQPETKCWILTEALTKSIYRVVTTDQKLTNSFWNFYPAIPQIGVK
jgi:hypothetical protein